MSSLLKTFIFGLCVAVTTITTPIALAAPDQKADQDQTQDQSKDASSSFSPQQVKDIQKIVHDYLLAKPEVLVEASQVLQQQQVAKQNQQAIDAIKANAQLLFKDQNSPVAGNPEGDAILVEFFDYQCGHCKTMNTIVQSLIKQNKNLKVIFKEFPIFGANSVFATKAALSANAKGKYLKAHDALLSVSDPVTPAKVKAALKKLGLSQVFLDKAQSKAAYAEQIRNTYKLAQAIGIQGTPFFIVANKDLTQFVIIRGAVPQERIEAAIKQVTTPGASTSKDNDANTNDADKDKDQDKGSNDTDTDTNS